MRRLFLLLLAAASTAQLCLAQTQTGPADWRQFRWSPDNAGRIPGELDVQWRYKGPGPIRGFAVGRSTMVVGTESHGTIAALDLRTGERRWILDLPGWVHGDPAVVGNAVYVTFGGYPFDAQPGGVWRIDLETGRVRWKFASGAGIMPSPAISRDTLFVGGGDSCIHTLSGSDGRALKSWCTGAPIAMSSPRFFGDTLLLVGNTGGYVLAFNARMLRPEWRTKVPPIEHFGDPPVALAGRMALTTGFDIVGVGAAFREAGFFSALPLIWHAWRNGRMGNHARWFMQHTLVALDAATGQQRWSRNLGIGVALDRNTSGTPVITRDVVIVSSPISRTVRAFRIETGEPVWQRRLEATHRGAVTIVDDDVILGDQRGQLIFLDRATGAVRGRCQFPAPFTVTQPVVLGRTILVPTADGAMYAERYADLRARAMRGASAAAERCVS